MYARRAFLSAVVVMCVSAILVTPGLVSGSTLGLPFVTVQARGLAPSRSAQEAPAAARCTQRIWLGEDGNPLPFCGDDEIKEFLLTADIVDIKPIGIGVTKPERMTLEKDGVRAHAVFRYFDRLYPWNKLSNGRRVANFRDSFRFEVAAYELSRLLGMNNVPPAVTRRFGDRNGSLQLWVYSSLMESERVEQRLRPPDRMKWIRQRHLMALFDALIGNTDRNAGNMLIDGDWNLWLIDHTRAFYAHARYEHFAGLVYVERTYWNRLRRLDGQQLDEALRGHLTSSQIDQILERRGQLVADIEALIAECGADAVLYDAVSHSIAPSHQE